MEKYQRKESLASKAAGFTLLETLLVLAIVGAIMVMAINYGSRQMAQERRDKIAIQMQQILTAGLAYYTNNGGWPVSSCIYKSNVTSNATAWSNLNLLAGYLPSSLTANSYGYNFNIACDQITSNVFYVNTQVNSHAVALSLAGMLPVAYTSDAFGNPSSTGTYVTAQVTTPGENLNNARSVNFTGIYHHGACVPVPICPGYNVATSSCITGSNCMAPQIMVVPVSLSGVNDTGSSNVYAMASFTAYAYGPSNTPVDCDTGTTPTACSLGSGIAPNYSSPLYWRVCVQVVAQKGLVSTTNTGSGGQAWGQYATVMAVTRCAPPNEPYGSDFTVFTQ